MRTGARNRAGANKRNSSKRKVGRPNVFGRNAALHFRIKSADRAALQTIARTEQRSLSDVVNMAVAAFIKSKQQPAVSAPRA